MNHHRHRLKPALRLACRLAALTCAAMLGANIVGLVSHRAFDSVTLAAPLAPGAGPAGALTIDPASGDSSTNFGLAFPSPQTCPGTGASGYRWHTFITPAGADVASFTWTNQGSPQGGPGFTRNLFSAGGSAVRGNLPDNVDGGIGGVPTDMQLAGGGVFGPPPAIPIPAGDYVLGIACVFPDAGFVNRTERYWTVAVMITADAVNGGPAQVVYGTATPPTTTTTTSVATTTTVAATTTTVARTTTTTTVASATTSTTTTTVPGQTTTTTVARGGSPATPVSGGQVPPGGGTTTYSSTGSLVATGWSETSLVVWAVLLLVFGRIAILLGRTTKVIDER